jgi:hypothetical protein
MAEVLGFTSYFIRFGFVALAILGLWVGLRRARLLPKARMTGIVTTGVLVVWFVTTDQLGRAGFYAPHWTVMRPVGWAIAILWLIPLLRSQSIGTALDTIPPWCLIGLQFYRALGGLQWYAQWSAGRVPTAFALWVGTFDFLTGILAVVVAIYVYVYSGARGGRALGVAWNVFGILDFASSFVIGTFVPYTLPYPAVMIPAFSAPLSLDFHALSLRQLMRASRRESQPAALLAT